MARQLFAFEEPRRFIVGTVGEPGERVFYLQAADEQRTVSVVLEKIQVVLLAQRLDELLDEAERRLGVAIPEDVSDLVDNEPMANPVEEEFRVGALGLIWDAPNQSVLVEAIAADDEGLPDDERDILRVRLTPAQARAFVTRAELMVTAGRPPCPLCGQPLSPEGHVCPRQNGYRPRSE